jgi:hypothetical protein
MFSVQLDSGQFQEQSQEYQRWKEWREKVAGELRQSVSTYNCFVLFCFDLLSYYFFFCLFGNDKNILLSCL